MKRKNHTIQYKNCFGLAISSLKFANRVDAEYVFSIILLGLKYLGKQNNHFILHYRDGTKKVTLEDE